jgi:hypothetical protein
MMKNAFTDHPAAVGETYGAHLAMASGFGVSMILGGLACLVHGLLPFLFVKTGSRTTGRGRVTSSLLAPLMRACARAASLKSSLKPADLRCR